jgi:DNA-binding transcriptional ArsR family regulator
MTTSTTTPTKIDWQAVAETAMKPVAIRILQTMADSGERSPADLHATLGDMATLPTISYHVRILADRGLLRVTRTERRGVIQHFYTLSGKATM